MFRKETVYDDNSLQVYWFSHPQKDVEFNPIWIYERAVIWEGVCWGPKCNKVEKHGIMAYDEKEIQFIWST